MATPFKVRFCPSPTGKMHLGNARTALFNALYSRGQQGIFLFRIEDTDRERSKEAFTEQLKQDLRWLGLDWQEGPDVGGDAGPYWQSQRQAIYDRYYQVLEEKDLVYPCFCSEEKLAITRKAQLSSGQPPRYPGTCRSLTKAEVQQKLDQGIKPTLRFKIPANQEVVFEDLVKGTQRFKTNDIGDFIIRRQTGSSPFMYCNAIDDALMGVTHVVRGEDHLTNSPRQIMILQALGLPVPTYCHISLILGPDGSPLSKRNGSRSISELQEEGFLPHALQNYLARLGHYYADNNLLTMNELAEQFQVANLSSSPARFNEEQLRYWQKAAVTTLTDAQVWTWIQDAVADKVPAELQMQFTAVIRPNISFPDDAALWADKLFAKKLELSPESLTIIQQAGLEFFGQASMLWQNQQYADFKAYINAVKEATGIKGKSLFQPLRVALTGDLHGPDLNPLAELLGKERIASRLQHAQDDSR